MDKYSKVKMYNADRDLSKEHATTGKGGPTVLRLFTNILHHKC